MAAKFQQLPAGQRHLEKRDLLQPCRVLCISNLNARFKDVTVFHKVIGSVNAGRSRSWSEASDRTNHGAEFTNLRRPPRLLPSNLFSLIGRAIGFLHFASPEAAGRVQQMYQGWQGYGNPDGIRIEFAA